MHTIVLTIETPPYGVSKFLVITIQPTLNKSQHQTKDYAKTWKISPTDIQVSYDVVNLYLSVPLDKAIHIIVGYLKKDSSYVKTRT